MSLIDDALKRAQAAGEGDRGRPGERPWIPTPMPDAGLARRRALLRGFSIAVAAAALLAAGLIVVGRAVREAPPLPAGEGRGERRSAGAAAAPTPTPDAVAVASPIAVTPPVGRSRPTGPPRSAADAAAAAAPSDAPPTSAAPRSSQAIADGRTYPGAVTLPGGAKIELGGIVWSETEPRALLNDRIVATGGYVEGFSVARIEEDRVVLERDGVTIYLSVK